MALSQADLQVISTVFGKTVEEISGAISNEENVSLGLRLNGRVISQEDEKQIRENGIQQGKEIGSKELAKALELDLDAGEKDPKIVAEKLKSTLSATYEDKYKNQSPPEALLLKEKEALEWKQKFEKLTGTYEEKVQEVEQWNGKYSELEKTYKQKELNQKVKKALPDKMKFDKDDALIIFNATYGFDDEGNVVDRNKNEKVLSATGTPETLENVIANLAEQKKWVRGSGINGAGGEGGYSGKKGLSPEEAEKVLKEQGIDPGSQEGLDKFIEMTK